MFKIQDTYIKLTQNEISLLQKGDLTISPCGLFTRDNIHLSYLTALRGNDDSSFFFVPVPLTSDKQAAAMLKKFRLISPLLYDKIMSLLSIKDIPLINTVIDLANLDLLTPSDKALGKMLENAGGYVKDASPDPASENVKAFCENIPKLINIFPALTRRTADTKDNSVFLKINDCVSCLDKLIVKVMNNIKDLSTGLREYELIMLFALSLSLPLIISEYCTLFYSSSGRLPACLDSWMWTFSKTDSDEFRSGVLNSVSFRFPKLSCTELMNAQSFPVNAACLRIAQLRDLIHFAGLGSDSRSLSTCADDLIKNKKFSASDELFSEPLIFSTL